ncbi:MAG: hypothetical protein QM764_05725 [Chitinophagaceae bacterium]
MSAWRKKAIECLPESKKDFEDPDMSIYNVFSELLSAAVDFHKVKNIESLQKIYDFAEWCFRQKSKDLWNAAGISFYEHLGDYPETRQEMRQWVKPDIYKDIRGLLELRLIDKELQQIDKTYQENIEQ